MRITNEPNPNSTEGGKKKKKKTIITHKSEKEEEEEEEDLKPPSFLPFSANLMAIAGATLQGVFAMYHTEEKQQQQQQRRVKRVQTRAKLASYAARLGPAPP